MASLFDLHQTGMVQNYSECVYVCTYCLLAIMLSRLQWQSTVNVSFAILWFNKSIVEAFIYSS